MFLMFGWQPRIKDLGPVVRCPCRRCNDDDAAWHLYTISMWISLFLIPVLPTGVENWLRCRECGDGIHLHPDQNALIRKGDPADDPTVMHWVQTYQRGAHGAPPDDAAH